ncbi:MAG: FCD domain-containing protein [Alphaproteobacteria bacterium]|nr:FCD domain-containing protein [Alphaproteobacteria bacterium]
MAQTHHHTNLAGTGSTLAHLRGVLAKLAESDETLPPERELVKQLGVPRSRLRRVLAEMRASGQLPPAQVGRRTTRKGHVRTEALARLANPTDVIELRLALEPQFARLAALRASPLEIARITRDANSSPDDDYGAPDLAFHLAIAGASRNALGHELYNVLRQVGADARIRLPSRSPMCPKRREARDAEHRRIARAIAERDPESAEEAMLAHLASVRALIMDRMSPQSAKS